jgi:hypothetical protein
MTMTYLVTSTELSRRRVQLLRVVSLCLCLRLLGLRLPLGSRCACSCSCTDLGFDARTAITCG